MSPAYILTAALTKTPLAAASLLGIATPAGQKSGISVLSLFAPAAWSGAADVMLSWIVQALVLGTAAAFATWLMFVALRGRLRPGLQVAFWLVVLVRFVVPDGPQFSWSLASMVSRVAPAVAAAPTPAAPPAPAVDDSVWEFIPITAPLAGAGAAPMRRAAPASMWATFPWRLSIACAYSIAVSLIVLRRTIRYTRFLRAAERLPGAAPEILALVADICAARGLRYTPRVRVSDASPAPFIYGFLRPTLVLSGRMLSCPRELEAVVLHEIAHLRRGDLWARALQCLAGTLLFFWPVVAWVNRRIDLAREHACDEWALRHSQLSPGEYARCLLRAAQGRGAKTVGYAPAAMAANLSHVERRIDMILNTSNPTRGGMLRFLAAGTLLGWSAFVLTGAASSKPLSADDARKPVVIVKHADGDGLWTAVSDDAQAPAGMSDIHQRIMQHVHQMLSGNGGDPGQGVVLKLALDAAHGDLADSDFQVQGVPILSQLPLIGTLFQPDGADISLSPTDHVAIFEQEINTDDGTPVRIAMVRGPGEAARAEFLANHPTADADADGVLSAAEHNAYLIAQAMSAPAGVLAQYPSSDLDSDGALSAEEAAQLLVAGPTPAGLPGGMKFLRLGGDGANGKQHTIAFRAAVRTNDADAAQSTDQDIVLTKPTDAGATEAFSVQLAPKVSADGKIELKVNGQPLDGVNQNVVIRTRNGDGDAQAADVQLTNGVNVFTFNQKIETSDLPVPPSVWIGQNIDMTPTAEQVAQYVPLAEQAPLNSFLRMNPAADADQDGVLTPEERDGFLEQHFGHVRKAFMSVHPEADTDGDGKLSDAEMKAFKVGLGGPSTGARKIVFGSPVRVEDLHAIDGGQFKIELRQPGDGDGPK